MSETHESARRWSGYVCPDCRLVFRVPRDHDGSGLVCQGCRRLLRLPTAGEPTPPLLAEPIKSTPIAPQPAPANDMRSADASSEVPDSQRSKRRVRKRRSAESHSETPKRPSWEHENSRRSKSNGHERQSMQWMLGGGLAIFALAAWGGWFVLRGDGTKTKAVAEVPRPSPSPATPAESAGVAELPAIMQRSVPSILTEIEPLARKFLEAKSPDELLPVIRNPQRAKPRLMRQYPKGRIEPPGLAQFNTSGNLIFGDSSAVVEVRTRNSETRQLTFVVTPEGLKIDWESWAGWSEMTWPALLAEVPTQATAFRVVVKRVDYYNFSFSDDTQWQSYGLESPDGEHMIFGYVKRGSAAAEKIHMSSDVEQAAMIVKIRFPAQVASSNNQVVIDDVLSNDWLEKDE